MMVLPLTSLQGISLGSGDASEASHVAFLAYFIALCYGALNGFFFICVLGGIWIRKFDTYFDFAIFLGTLWGRVYTSDPTVLSLFSSSFYIMWLYTVLDVMKCVGISILRGCGRPEITVFGNFLACILFGFPLAFVFVFNFEWGLVGLWGAMCVAWLTCSMLYFGVIYHTNWKEEVEKARGRTLQT